MLALSKPRGRQASERTSAQLTNIFILTSLIDKQRHTRLKGKAGKLFRRYVDFKKSVWYCITCCAMADAGAWCRLGNPECHQVYICTRDPQPDPLRTHAHTGLCKPGIAVSRLIAGSRASLLTILRGLRFGAQMPNPCKQVSHLY